MKVYVVLGINAVLVFVLPALLWLAAPQVLADTDFFRLTAGVSAVVFALNALIRPIWRMPPDTGQKEARFVTVVGMLLIGVALLAISATLNAGWPSFIWAGSASMGLSLLSVVPTRQQDAE